MNSRTSAVLFLALRTGTGQPRANPMRIAHAQDFAPLAVVKDGESEGLAVDIVRAAAERAGLEVTFVAVPFEQTQITLADGRADAVFPLAITAERRQFFDFTEGLLVTGGT